MLAKAHDRLGGVHQRLAKGRPMRAAPLAPMTRLAKLPRFVTVVLTSTVIMACGGDSGTDTRSAPVISSVTPSAGPLAGGTGITIAGANFVDVIEVTVGGVPATDLHSTVTTQISGRTPPGMSPGAKDVVVRSLSNGSGSCTACFTYNPAITITSVSPNSGPLGGGTNITITGTNFVDVSLVAIDDVPLTNVVVSPTTITATTPAGATSGAKNLTVVSSSHGVLHCTECFAYTP